MRRWSVVLYAGLVGFNAVAGALVWPLAAGAGLRAAAGGAAVAGLALAGLLLPGLLLVIVLRHYRGMR
jgi:hypothetical protein